MNRYLSALESKDASALATSIRALSSLSQESNQAGPSHERTLRQRREAELAETTGTPYISRTPFGGAGLETPLPEWRVRQEEDERIERLEHETKRRRINYEKGLDVSH